MKNITTIILAAGKSKRFKSQKSKILHEIAGRPLIDHVYSLAKKISKNNVFIVCNQENIKFIKSKFNNCKIVLQNLSKGTADAVYLSKKYIIKNTNLLILYGDVPLIKESSIKRLIIRSKTSKNPRSILVFNTKNPYGYGRVEVKGKKVIRVTEEFLAKYYLLRLFQ